MPYTLIKGEFHIHYPDTPRNGPEPDGDTLKFRPDERQLVENLPRPGRPPKFTQTGITTIRFEGIDALETHFSVDGDEYHQHMALAEAARDKLLEETGFGEVAYFDDLRFKVKAVEHHPIRGYLLSNGLDTFGRAIAFVYAGDHPAVDGASIFVRPPMLEDSLNAIMLAQGHAYAGFYLSMPADLREHLFDLVSTARAEQIGLWENAAATTTRPAEITGPHELQQLVIWPKLFRRLAAFFHDGHTDLAALDAWLRADPRDRDDRLILPNRELGNMHDLILVVGSRLRLAHRPEEVVMVPDDYTLPESPSGRHTFRHTGPGFIRLVAALVNPQERPEGGHETVTLLNTTTADVDLGNWFIADQNGRQALQGVIASGETLRVRLTAGVRLNNTRDTITLLDPKGHIIDQVSYEARHLPEEGETVAF
jgi:endonuclease YncB( thermonuclease family)